MNGSNLGPYFSAPPISIPGVAKVSCQGATQIEQHHFLVLLDFYKKSFENNPEMHPAIVKQLNA